MKYISNNQKGFTIIELMIASVVFSIVLLGASAALIQIGKMYYKGVISSRTQNAARVLIDDISRGVQFEGDEVIIGDTNLVEEVNGVSKGAFCIGQTRYTFVLNRQVSEDSSLWGTESYSAHALWKDTVDNPDNTTCSRAGSPSLVTCEFPAKIAGSCATDTDVEGEELLGEGMRLSDLTISTPQANLWDISINVAYGDDDVFIDNDVSKGCRGIITGSQWCAISKLNTSVYKRIEGE